MQTEGSGHDMTNIAGEQQNKLQSKRDKIISPIKRAMPEKEVAASGDSKSSASVS